MTRRGKARREERHDRRDVGQPSGGAARYKVRQKMASIGQDFWIETESGQKAFKVDGKAMRVRSTLLFEDAQRHELYKIQEKIKEMVPRARYVRC